MELKISKLARADLNKIYDYWDERNQSSRYSAQLNDEFFNQFYRICQSPFSGKLSDYRQSVRAKLLREYWIIYAINANDILILRIWDFRRNPHLISKYLQ